VREINLSAKTPAANAAVVGMGKTRKIVLGDTLLEEFSRDEVEVVVAHELGHHVHHDLAKGLALDAALSLPGFLLADVALHLAVRSWHFAGVWDLGAFPVLALTFGVWSAVSAPLARAHSRRVEASADAFSIALTGKGQAFVDGEIRLTNQNLAWFHPPTWLEALFYTHPAPWRRVAMGEKHLRDGEVSV
jgi:STE24 endopeptidase